MGDPEDPYSRIQYRRLIAWPERIRREEPFLRKVFASTPAPRILDLGCGTGEHARFLASMGFAVTGLDVSEAMLKTAREEAEPPVAYVQGDLSDVASLVEPGFGGALCLGNTLPHVLLEEALARFASGLAARVLPGAPFLLQVLNYEKIFSMNQRFLPLNFKKEEDGEIVFLRLMAPRPDGTLTFNPTTLRYRPGQEPPVEVLAARNVSLRGWRRADLEPLLSAAGWRVEAAFGGMREEPYRAGESPDLVLLARRVG